MLSNNHYHHHHRHLHRQHHCPATHTHNAITIYISVCWFLFWYLHCSFPNSRYISKSGTFSLVGLFSISPILHHRLFNSKNIFRERAFSPFHFQFFFSLQLESLRIAMYLWCRWCSSFAICILQISQKICHDLFLFNKLEWRLGKCSICGSLNWKKKKDTKDNRD